MGDVLAFTLDLSASIIADVVIGCLVVAVLGWLFDLARTRRGPGR